MKRLCCGLLALCLLWGPPASAASGDRLTLSCRERGGEVRLTLEGLERQAYALQLELDLEGECPGARFSPAPRGAYSPECRAETGRGGTRVSIYLVSEEPLEGRSLELGTLTPGDSFRLPDRGELVLLDRGLRPIYEGRISLEGDRSGAAADRVRVVPAEHGSVSVRPAGAREGETVLLSVSPDGGYALEVISARDSRGREVPLTRDALNRFAFTMPEGDVEVTASFVPGGDLAFQDVRPGDWCYGAVRWAFETGLMNGTSATAFTPGAPTTRGQIVAILHRLEGGPAASPEGFVIIGGEPAGASFTDVRPTAYYAAAVAWATENGIVNGYGDGTFRPDNLITREQMAAFLYRYASQKGRDVSARAPLGGFSDAGQAAPYAVEPLGWAVSAGLINGVTADTLVPQGTATRAQAAVILSRFAENVL